MMHKRDDDIGPRIRVRTSDKVWTCIMEITLVVQDERLTHPWNSDRSRGLGGFNQIHNTQKGEDLGLGTGIRIGVKFSRCIVEVTWVVQDAKLTHIKIPIDHKV